MLRRLTAVSIFSFLVILTGTGQDYPTLGDIHDFEPGDIFETAHYYCCNEVFFQVERRIIQEKFNVDGKKGYLITLSQFDLLWKDPFNVVDTTLWQQNDTIWILNPDSVIFTSDVEIIQNPEWYQGSEIFIRKYFLLNALCEERYVRGCGMVYMGWGTPPSTTTHPQDSLSWYCKTDGCWGNSLLAFHVTALEHGILIYPNPVKQTLKISQLGLMEVRSIRLLDMNGRTTRFIEDHGLLNGVRLEFPVSDLNSGVYFLSIETENGPFLQKIIKL